MAIPKWKKSPTGKWIKVKTKEGWEKILAPALEEKINLWLLIMKKVLEFLDFKCKEIDEETIPKALVNMGFEDKKFSLPTKSLIANFSSMYPRRSIKCLYYGDSWFWVFPDYPDEFGKFLCKEVAQLYQISAKEWFKTKDISTVERKIREYYGIPEMKKVAAKKLIVKDLVKTLEKEEKSVEPQKLEIEKKEIPLLLTSTPQEKTEITTKPEEVELIKEPIEEVKLPEEIIPIPPIDEVIKKVNEFQPKDAFEQMAKIKFEAVISKLRDEKLKEKLYYAFFPIIEKGKTRDFFEKATEIEREQENILKEKWLKQKS